MERGWIDVSGEPMNLAPGMAASAEMAIEQRRLIEFFAAPLLSALNEADKKTLEGPIKPKRTIMRRVIDLLVDKPSQHLAESLTTRMVVPVVLVVSLVYYSLHFILLYVVEPSHYPEVWLRFVEVVREFVPAVTAWENTTHALREQMPSLYVLGLICGIFIFVFTSLFSSGMTLFDRTSNPEVTNEQFVRAVVTVLMANTVFIYILFLFPDSGPEAPPIDHYSPLRAVAESKFGNLVIFPLVKIVAYYWFGSNVAWVKVVLGYYLKSWMNRK
jgi:hypothetical protein